MRAFKMQQVALALPALPGLSAVEGRKTYAAWPVWSDSTTKTIRFQPLSKKVATRLFHRARQFDRQTNRPGHHGGAVGPTALQVLHTLIFDFLNYATGRLDPSYAAIARKANLCERAVASALKRLRELGILNWGSRPQRAKSDAKEIQLFQLVIGGSAGVSRKWGDEERSDMTGRIVAGWKIVDGVGFAVGRNRHG